MVKRKYHLSNHAKDDYLYAFTNLFYFKKMVF